MISTKTQAFAILTSAFLALAFPAHGQTPQRHDDHASSKIDYFYRLLPPDAPQHIGQETLGAIQETVGLLLADPTTDWSKVSVARLRRHLVDLDAVMLRSRVEEKPIDGGLEILVDGDSATLEAARRVVPAHVAAVEGFRGWRVEVLDGATEDGTPLRLRLIAPDESETEILRALGFFGFLASGIHRPGYHLALARGVPG